MKRTLITLALLALLAASAASIASAQGEDVSLKGLAGYVRALQRRVGTNEQRLAAIETAIAPTATATPRPTSTPAPTATDSTSVAATTVAMLIGADYMSDPFAWQGLTQQEKNGLALVYTGFMVFAADHCNLSYEDMAFLLNNYADVLDEAEFTSPEGIKPRGWLLSYLWGFAKDGIDDLEAVGIDCDWILDSGVFTVFSFWD